MRLRARPILSAAEMRKDAEDGLHLSHLEDAPVKETVVSEWRSQDAEHYVARMTGGGFIFCKFHEHGVSRYWTKSKADMTATLERAGIRIADVADVLG